MDEQQKRVVSPLTLFYSYAHEDEWLGNALEKHLSLLHRQGLISEWHDRQILAGAEWARDIDQHLETASIILLLISSDFLASNSCYDMEMKRALERHQRGEARVYAGNTFPIRESKDVIHGVKGLKPSGTVFKKYKEALPFKVRKLQAGQD